MWHHPKYYKELKEFGKRGDRGNPTAASPDTDQAISSDNAPNMDRAHDGERERAPGPGLKPQAASSKPQATSSQASSATLHAPSRKHQASSRKRQAP